jgi:hypothetical protein
MKLIHVSSRLYRAIDDDLRRALARQGVVLRKGRKARRARARQAAYWMDAQDSWSDSAR